MNYALIKNGIVANIIWLNSGNAGDFPDAVPMDGRPVGIGDIYEGGIFLRDGNPVLTPLEEALADIDRLLNIIEGRDILC